MYHPDNSFAASPVISLSTASSLSRQVSLSLPSALCLLPGELNISEEREKREKQELKEKRSRERREEVIERYSVIGFLVKVGWEAKNSHFVVKLQDCKEPKEDRVPTSQERPAAVVS